MKDQEIIQLSDREHILLRPSMYLGSIDPVIRNEYVIEDKKFVKKFITYVPVITSTVS